MITERRGPVFFVGTVAAIILLLLFLRARQSSAILVSGGDYTPPPVVVNTVQYQLPGFTIPSLGGAYDWMQTTDLACGCEVGGPHFDPTKFESPSVPAVSPPAYVFIRQQPSPPPSYYYPAPPTNFEVATFPGPTWWWGWQNFSRVVYLSSGQVLPAGGLNREFVLNGSDLSFHGYHYSHDASRDVGL